MDKNEKSCQNGITTIDVLPGDTVCFKVSISFTKAHRLVKEHVEALLHDILRDDIGD